ncbi:cofilin-like [Pecten maximus]|uniref:cofilin-like n=1 Tax=Pecten maximus TaxID=6579 RepID=UPI001458002E|nr:cofilin-like [Pecten maximus]
MASGVKTSDECVQAFERLKKDKCSKFCLFKLNQKLSEVVLDTEAPCNKKDNKFNCYKAFLKNLPEKECRYGAFEYGGRQDHEGKAVSKLLFVSWAPATAGMRQKMVHASSLSAVKDKLNVNDVLQVTELDELDEDVVCDKLRIKLDKEHCEKMKREHPFEEEEYHQEQQLQA